MIGKLTTNLKFMDKVSEQVKPRHYCHCHMVSEVIRDELDPDHWFSSIFWKMKITIPDLGDDPRDQLFNIWENINFFPVTILWHTHSDCRNGGMLHCKSWAPLFLFNIHWIVRGNLHKRALLVYAFLRCFALFHVQVKYYCEYNYYCSLVIVLENIKKFHFN